MAPYSTLIAVIIAFGLCDAIATAEPLGLLRSGNPFGDGNGNNGSKSNDSSDSGQTLVGSRYNHNIRQKTKSLAYSVESNPYETKKRTILLDLFPEDEDFSMPSAAPSGDPRNSNDEPSTDESVQPTALPDQANSTSVSPSFEIPVQPSTAPSDVVVSENPSAAPSEVLPSENPSASPSEVPSEYPTPAKNKIPSENPSAAPSNVPTENPTTSKNPSAAPSKDPTENPTTSKVPTEDPTVSLYPTLSLYPSLSNFTDDFFEGNETEFPSTNPSLVPSPAPTLEDCLISEEERAAQIFGLLEAAANSTKLRDLGTPQGLAADWLIHQDFRKECPSEKILQRWVIAVFYFATDGESWEQCSAAGSDPCGSEFPFAGKRRFLSDFSECEWAGITCNDDDCVTEIEFEANGLVGTIPTELGLLTELAVMGMERGGLSSTIPSEIGLLTKLVFLDLDFNELSGSLPTALYLLTDLETLDLNDNFLEGDIDMIGIFGKLEFLQLQSNQFTGTVPEDVGNLTLMTTFNLHENMFSGVIPESVCDLRESNGGLLKSLIADCANTTAFGPDIECDCCSSCRG